MSKLELRMNGELVVFGIKFIIQGSRHTSQPGGGIKGPGQIIKYPYILLLDNPLGLVVESGHIDGHPPHPAKCKVILRPLQELFIPRIQISVVVIARQIKHIQRIVIARLLPVQRRYQIVAVRQAVIPVVIYAKGRLNILLVFLHCAQVFFLARFLIKIPQCMKRIGLYCIKNALLLRCVGMLERTVLLFNQVNHPIDRLLNGCFPVRGRAALFRFHRLYEDIHVLRACASRHRVIDGAKRIIIIPHPVRMVMIQIPAAWDCA